jgi:hypothetical protein
MSFINSLSNISAIRRLNIQMHFNNEIINNLEKQAHLTLCASYFLKINSLLHEEDHLVI